MDLRTYLDGLGLDAEKKFAADLSVTKEAVRLWLTGARTPRPEMMRRILEKTAGKVTPGDFVAPERAAQ